MNYVQARQEWVTRPYVKRLIDSGAERDEIAQELSVNPMTVSEYCKRYWNMTFRDAQLNFFYKPQLKDMIYKGFTLVEVGKKLKKDPSTISDWCKKLYGSHFQDTKKNIYSLNTQTKISEF